MNRIMPRLTKPDKRHVTESARLMTKYIFPRQYGFHNVFDFEKERGAWPFRDYTIRDGEIEVNQTSGDISTLTRFRSVKVPLKHHLGCNALYLWS